MEKRTYTEKKNAAREKSLRELAEWRNNEHFSRLQLYAPPAGSTASDLCESLESAGLF